MPSLKDLKNRIKSIKNTQKITKAQKMVAAAKLRRAQERAEAARPYAEQMEKVLKSLAERTTPSAVDSLLLTGTGRDEKHLIIVLTSDRGLAGAFNSSIVRATRRKIHELEADGKQVVIFTVGRKAHDMLRLEHGKRIVARLTEVGKRQVSFQDAQHIVRIAMEKFANDGIDVVHIVYNRFKSAISQTVTFQQIIPLPVEGPSKALESGENPPPPTPYEYEPSEEEILADLLTRNLAVQLYRALLENAASEQGARMTAMDNATRNAGEIINKLTLKYNRTRQAAITKELIEIISGAEAL
jgi:F-type H+-transporting ATPase subunit gamma